jgi:hypothetical protein
MAYSSLPFDNEPQGLSFRRLRENRWNKLRPSEFCVRSRWTRLCPLCSRIFLLSR